MLGKAARIVNNLQLVNAPFGILAVEYEGCIKNSKNVLENVLLVRVIRTMSQVRRSVKASMI